MAKGIKGSGEKKDAPARTTIFIRPSKIYKLKLIALNEKSSITAIIDTLTDEFIAKWEKKHGEVVKK